MKRLHDLKARICDFDNLMGAYRDAAREKMYREEVITFTLDLGNNLHKLLDELEGMDYEVGPYREFYVRYPKPRLVMALGFRGQNCTMGYLPSNKSISGQTIYHT